MKSIFLILTILFSMPALAGDQVKFSDGEKVSDALNLDMTKFTTMEARKPLDLKKYGIVFGNDLKQTSSSCSINFRVRNRRVFQQRRNAQTWCDDLHRFSGLRNTCYVRQFGNNFYEASFRFRGQGRGNNFGNIFGNIANFLRDAGLFNNIFDFLFDDIVNQNRRC